MKIGLVHILSIGLCTVWSGCAHERAPRSYSGAARELQGGLPASSKTTELRNRLTGGHYEGEERISSMLDESFESNSKKKRSSDGEMRSALDSLKTAK